MKQLILTLALATGLNALAHDGGHGPKLGDTPMQGGVLAPVIDAKDAKKGKKAAVVYKAELTRSEDGTVKLFLYDLQMHPLPVAGLDKKASAVLETRGKGAKKLPFEMALEADVYVGKAPTPPKKPYDIEITVKAGDRNLLVAYPKLD